jgi:hypothetical protein
MPFRIARLTLLARVLMIGAQAQQPPTLDFPIIDPLGNVVLSVRGSPGTNYAVEVSSDLVSWWRLFSGTATNGSVGLHYLPATGNESRFFRAKMEVPLSPPSLTVAVDANAFMPVLVTPESGGTGTLIDSRGVSYALTVPTNALFSPVVVYINLVTNLSGLPLSSGLLAGVTLSPAGLSLMAPAQLVVTFPPELNIDTSQLAGYTFDANGQSLQLAPAAADTNTVSLSMPVLGGFGCSVATLDEARQLAQFVIANVGVPAIKMVKEGTGNGKGTGGIHALDLSFLTICYPDQESRAIAVSRSINRALTSFLTDLGEQGIELLHSHHHYPQAALGEYWAGNTAPAYEDFFNQNIKPYLTEAQSNCQLMVGLANQTFALVNASRTFGYTGDFPAIKAVAAAVCNAYQNCITQTQGCCLTKTVGGEGPIDELKVALGQATYWGCTYPADAINNADKACNPPWFGTLTIFESRELGTTNNLGTTIRIQILDQWIKTVVNADHLTVAGGIIADLSGTVKGNVTGHYSSLDETDYLTCECGECSDSTFQFSELASPVSGSIGLIWCTDPTNNLCPPNFTPAFTADTNTAPNLKQPSRVFTRQATSHKSGDSCLTTFLRSNFAGTQTFPNTIGPMYIADHENGSAIHVDGGYTTNYDEGDGTIHTITITWGFDKNTN